jgi:hypothetical protein
MDQDQIIQAITETFTGLDVVTGDTGIGAGDTFFFYDPERKLDPAHRFPFATIVTKDYGEFDGSSQLDRPGVFRLNIGVSRATYERLFGPPPRGIPRTGEVLWQEPTHDFTILDQLLPHPVYAPQAWVCVLNPSAATFETLAPLLAEAHDRAARRYHATPPAGETTDSES